MKTLIGWLVMLAITVAAVPKIYAQPYTCPQGPGPGEAMVGMSNGGPGTGIASIPLCVQTGQNQQQPQAPRPPPAVWADRWGAIASGNNTETGIVGKSAHMASKKMAEDMAMQDCLFQGGGKTCHIDLSYYNQCVASVWGRNSVGIGNDDSSAPTKEMAIEHAMKKCSQAATGCQVIYSDCSFAERVQ